MSYTLLKQIRDKAPLRQSFMKLAEKTFSLSFEGWYQGGFWGDRYIPYVVAQGDRVVACAAVNVMDFLYRGKTRNYIQIGTVMTDPAYRNKGFSRRLIEEILFDWREKCDGIYLFANDAVLHFYPKFGFVQAPEYQYAAALSPQPGDFRKCDMQTAWARAALSRCSRCQNPYSEFSMIKNEGLLFFYGAFALSDCVYYSEEYDAIGVFEQRGDTLVCYDLFCKRKDSLTTLLCKMAAPGAKRAVLGFTPAEAGAFSCAPLKEEDTTLFLLKGKEDLFTGRRCMFPLLSHA